MQFFEGTEPTWWKSLESDIIAKNDSKGSFLLTPLFFGVLLWMQPSRFLFSTWEATKSIPEQISFSVDDFDLGKFI